MTSYRTYWIAWGILLALTILMIAGESLGVPRVAAILFLVAAMLVKATVIGGWFMHLRFERAALVACVVLGILATGAVLFGIIATDGLHMLHQRP